MNLLKHSEKEKNYFSNDKEGILRWLEKYDHCYQYNIKNNSYELIDIHDVMNQNLLEEIIKRDNLHSDYFEKLKSQGHQYIVNVNGNCNISLRSLKKILIQFYHINGYFSCVHNQLTSLKGCPQIVNDHFDCSLNQLTSLKYGPQSIGGNFYCAHNQLTSLKGCPQHVQGSFSCSHNVLNSLEYSPQIIGNGFYCQNNQLTSLKYSPQIIGNNFICSNNQLTSLEYFPEIVQQEVYLDDNTQLLKYKSQSNESRIQNMSDDKFLQELDFKFWQQFHLQEKAIKENNQIISTLDNKYKKSTKNMKI